MKVPVLDSTDPMVWDQLAEARLFTTYDRMEQAGATEEQLDQYWTETVEELVEEREDVRRAAGLDLPWWERLWRWIKYQMDVVYLTVFPPERDKPQITTITNPVGSIPVLGQLFGFGMEIGKQLSGNENVIITNQYGELPIISDVFRFGGFLVDHYKIAIIGGVVVVALYGTSKLLGIARLAKAVI